MTSIAANKKYFLKIILYNLAPIFIMITAFSIESVKKGSAKLQKKPKLAIHRKAKG